MKIVSKFVESNQKIIQKAQGSGQSSEVILNYLDVIAETWQGCSFNQQHQCYWNRKRNVTLIVKYSRPVDLNVFGAQTKNGNLNLAFKDTENGTMLASAKIPADTFKNESRIVYCFLFRNDLLFQIGKVQSKLSSKIFAVSVGKEKIENLTSPI